MRLAIVALALATTCLAAAAEQRPLGGIRSVYVDAYVSGPVQAERASIAARVAHGMRLAGVAVVDRPGQADATVWCMVESMGDGQRQVYQLSVDLLMVARTTAGDTGPVAVWSDEALGTVAVGRMLDTSWFDAATGRLVRAMGDRDAER